MKFLRDEKGQGLSEYALIIALVAVVAIAGLVLLGPIILDKFNEISCGMQGTGWGNQASKAADVTAEGWWYFNGKDIEPVTGGKFIWTKTTGAGCYKVTATK